LIDRYEDAVLRVASVSNFTELRRFLGLTGSGEPSASTLAEVAAFIRPNFYPNVKPSVSDLDFLQEQGILSASGWTTRDVLFRLIDKKSAFEWQQGVLTAWDGRTMTFIVNGQPKKYTLSESAPIFQRIGEDRIAMQNGSWIGGELFDFRVVDDVVQMAVYRRNFVNPSADRYSRLAMWQVHKTKSELDTAFNALNIGSVGGIRVLERGESDRPVSTEVSGSRGKQVVRALRLRSLLGLRDSMFYFDEERNSRGELIGMSFYGTGWGHGVGMCQVGAFGMALDGAKYDEILKKYYTGIELQKIF
jgi:stage II sporulation protein D